MIPLTLLAIMPFLHPSSSHWGELSGFHHLDGSGFFSSALGHNWLVIYIAFSFLLTWNVIAMEAAACYIGECRDPERDAKIAMNLEGLYGLFIYTMIPIAFVVVLGATKLSNPLLADPTHHLLDVCDGGVRDGRVVARLADRDHARDRALAVVLNALMGSGRAIYQMSLDGDFPRIFSNVNKHGVPGFSMGFNVVCSIAAHLHRRRRRDLLLSNVGYLASFIPVLVAYYLLRRDRPDMNRPVRLPGLLQVHRPGDGGAATSSSGSTAASSTPACPTPHSAGPTPASTTSSAGPSCSATSPSTGTASRSKTPSTRRPRAALKPSRWPRETDRGIEGGSGVPTGIAPTRSRHAAHRAAGGRVGGPADRLVGSPAGVRACPPGQGERARDLDRPRVGHVARLPQPRPQPDQARVGRAAPAPCARRATPSRRPASRPRAMSSAPAGPPSASWRESANFGADAIVMGADRNRGLMGDFMWSHEPYRVARHGAGAGVPRPPR